MSAAAKPRPWFNPFGPDPLRLQAERLRAAVTAAARDPALYGPGLAPDTLEGRLEAATLMAALALYRLQSSADDDRGRNARLGQVFVDLLFRHFDAGLREAGVGDLSVPKRMRKIAASFYGRLGVYSAALDARDGEALAQALMRNLIGRSEPAGAPARALAAHALALAARQRQAPIAALTEADGWSAFSA